VESKYPEHKKAYDIIEYLIEEYHATKDARKLLDVNEYALIEYDIARREDFFDKKK
jgi:hypothetical protein